MGMCCAYHYGNVTMVTGVVPSHQFSGAVTADNQRLSPSREVLHISSASPDIPS